MGETIHTVLPSSFPFKLKPPKLIAAEIEAEAAQQEAAVQKAAQSKTQTGIGPAGLPSKYKSSGHMPLSPWGAVAGRPSAKPVIQFNSVLNVIQDLFGAPPAGGQQPDPPILPFARRWDEDYRATYSCEYYRNCANTAPLFEFRFEFP